MTQKIAIAVIHGIAQANPEFADKQSPNYVSGIAVRLQREIVRALPGVADPDLQLIIEPVYWSPVVQNPQDELFKRLQIRQRLSRFFGLRDFIFHSLADSIAYQPIQPASAAEEQIYEDIHTRFAETLRRLADQAGERAPLCVIAHSLGSAIASNFLWDLQQGRRPATARDNPLERGDTFTLFYTLGSQIPFWSLRFRNFGTPIQVPSPQLPQIYPNLQGQWLNFYDRNDLLGYPIEGINEEYRQVVKDIEVNVGNLLTRWNTLSHNEYWRSSAVTQPIAQGLANVWRQVNG
ncbi:hypothetical protein [Pseudanabaena sp. FACHB-2040]|uniref:hypothetical protein n=1 Tax=Pseudanabaena sp. FACHB-2040 TaxID=2692859 RepID=UPI001689E3AD|nr:hypothetical protein [Pseudanabaena sp. FACHB-2040]MBD2258666.1 hypothetical protein [Pseudanabaena sp. FACHB-2040]